MKNWVFLIFVSFTIFLFSSNDIDAKNLTDLEINKNVISNSDFSNPDVGITSILVPRDTVDSNGVIRPTALVSNYGDTVVTFLVVFYDTTFSYYDIQLVSNLTPDSTCQVRFNLWSITYPRGPLFVKCSTALANDVNNSNDAYEKQVLCRVKDVAVLNLFLPDTVDSGMVITPRALIKNFGNTQEVFWAIFKIGTTYLCSLEVTSPPPDSEDTLTFAPWSSTVRGYHAVSCTTAMPGDINPASNVLYGHILVRVKDFGVSQILRPYPIIPETSQLIPKVLVTNYGNIVATTKVLFIITDSISQIIYRDSNFITLAPQTSDGVTFTVWNADSGRYAAISYTSLLDDINPSNDTAVRYFLATRYFPDVGIDQILFPVVRIRCPYPPVSIEPQVIIINLSNTTVTFPVIFKISELYADTQVVTNLSPNLRDTINFSLWNVPYNPDPTFFPTSCSTALSGDTNSLNDIIADSFLLKFSDIGITAFYTRFDSLHPLETVRPILSIRNYGVRTESLPLLFYIYYLDDDSLVYADTHPNKILPPAVQDTICFDPWTVGPLGWYKGWIRLDTIPFIDTLSFTFEVIPVGIKEYQSITDFLLPTKLPNPLRANGKIRFKLPSDSDIWIKIYDEQGKLVTKACTKGIFTWNGENISGKKVTSGIYFIRFEGKNFARTSKVILQR